MRNRGTGRGRHQFVQMVVAVPTRNGEEDLLRKLADVQDENVAERGFLREFWGRLTR